jgi:hypothetical protein
MQRARAILEGKPVDMPAMNVATANPPLPQGAPSQSHTQSQFWESGPDGFELPPLGDDYDDARNGYALDFFTSQPVPRDQMVPVDLDINGQRRRVWASRESAQRALAGDAQIATVNYGGASRPWFEARDQYNPWNGFGSQFLQMMAMNMLINSMFNSGGYGANYGGYNSQFGGVYGGDHNNDWNRHNDRSRDYENSREQPDSRVETASHEAGEASLGSPFSDGDWSSSDNSGSSSLDIFGSGSSGSDSS